MQASEVARVVIALALVVSSLRVRFLQRTKQEVSRMANINWRDDADRALADAKREGRPLLFDFSAAPM